MTATWYRRPRVWIALGVFLLAIVVYQNTTSPSISFWDCGEYITTSHIIGIPHQPGTPLYVLVGRCFDILLGSPGVDGPALETARAVNFMSALFSALALMLVYLIILEMARRADPDCGWLAHVGGLVGAVFLLLSETFWNNAIEAEVYGLAAFMISLLTWLAIRWYDACTEIRSNRLLYLMIYLLGLGVGFHLGSLLVFPGIFVLVVLSRKRQIAMTDLFIMSAGLALFLLSTMLKNNSFLLVMLAGYLAVVIGRVVTGSRFVLVGSGLFLLGLTVYFMMMARAPLDPAINQTQPETFGTMMSVLRREQYPPINVFERQADLIWQFKYYYSFFIEQFYFIGNGKGFLAQTATFLGPIFLGLLGIFHGIRRAKPLIFMLITNYLINGEALTLYLNFTDHEVRERDYFYFAAFLFFAIFIGIGVSALLRITAGAEGKSAAELKAGERPPAIRFGFVPKVAAVLLLVIALWPVLQPGHTKFFEHDRSENVIAREYAWNLLAGLDENAILYTNGDNDTFPVWYLQEVEHFRRDVTVVNLSLVNLPWYVKQMRRHDPPMPGTYSDAEIDQLRARMYIDEETGQEFIIFVRDYVVHDIVTTNAQSGDPRPVFFAVTIPRENMERYFPYLQMEGLAYRLVPQKSADGNPVVEGTRLLHNMLGVYDYDGMLLGDSDKRRQQYGELTGWYSDAVEAGRGGPGGDLSIPYEPLVAEVGEQRTDVYRDDNTRNLLGNYPAALVRTAYSYLTTAQQVVDKDSLLYREVVDKALAAFELARRFDPFFQPVVDLYPIVLVDKARSDEALAFLETLSGNIAPADEEKVIYETITAMTQVGEANHATRWLNEAIAREPARKFHYNLLFRLYQSQRNVGNCRLIYEQWREVSGEDDRSMREALDRLEQDALQREQERIEETIEGGQ
ncbi:MAG: DUF2723 domain-containing protein [bacterium]